MTDKNPTAEEVNKTNMENFVGGILETTPTKKGDGGSAGVDIRDKSLSSGGDITVPKNTNALAPHLESQGTSPEPGGRTKGVSTDLEVINRKPS